MALSQTLTKSKIFSKITDEQLFTVYFGEFDLNKSYRSPFREDKRPSTGFFISSQGRLVYNDFTTGEKLDAIDFAGKLKGLSGVKLLRAVLEDFGFKNADDFHAAAVIDPEIKAARKEKKEKLITFDFDKWNESNLEYWKQYSITKEELVENRVYPVKNVYVNRFQLADSEHNRYVYLIPHGKEIYSKVYTPLCSEYKWLGNIPLAVPFGLDTLPYKSDTLIITKAAKERMILKKFFTDVIAVQNESLGALPQELIEFLRTKYKRIIVWFDNDETGLRACEEFANLGFETMHFAESMYEKGVKDIGDFVVKYGIENFEKYLKWKKLIGT